MTLVIPFDEIGSRYDETFTDRAAQLALGQRIVDELPRGSRVLDHGCGSGVPTARQLADAGFDVVGVDESAVMLDLAMARVPEATFIRRDLRDLGPDLGSFDAVTSFLALLMLPRAQIPDVLRGLRTRLRSGGLLALGMVAGDLDGVEIPFLGVPVAVSAYPSDELAAVVADAGLTVDSFDEVTVGAENGRVERQQLVLARRHRTRTGRTPRGPTVLTARPLRFAPGPKTRGGFGSGPTA